MTGLHILSGDLWDGAEKTDSWWRDVTPRGMMGERASAWTRSHFSAPEMASAYRRLYEEGSVAAHRGAQ